MGSLMSGTPPFRGAPWLQAGKEATPTARHPCGAPASGRKDRRGLRPTRTSHCSLRKLDALTLAEKLNLESRSLRIYADEVTI